MAVLRLPSAMGAEPVEQAGAGVGKVAVPDLVGPFRQFQPGDFLPACRIKQAQVDPVGIGGEHGEIDAEPVEGGTERIGRTRL
jgi:hypothetical protein